MAITYAQRLAKAMAADAHEGTEHRGDAVLCQMLAAIPAHLARKDQQTHQLLKSRQAVSADARRAASAGDDDLDDDEKVRQAREEGKMPSPHTAEQKVRRTAAASGSTAQQSGGGREVGIAKLKKAPVGALVKSAPATPAVKPAPFRSWTPAQVQQALDDGVARGRDLGTRPPRHWRPSRVSADLFGSPLLSGIARDNREKGIAPPGCSTAKKKTRRAAGSVIGARRSLGA